MQGEGNDISQKGGGEAKGKKKDVASMRQRMYLASI